MSREEAPLISRADPAMGDGFMRTVYSLPAPVNIEAKVVRFTTGLPGQDDAVPAPFLRLPKCAENDFSVSNTRGRDHRHIYRLDELFAGNRIGLIGRDRRRIEDNARLTLEASRIVTVAVPALAIVPS